MKIFSIENIRKADAYTIQHEPIRSIDLMERVASNCVNYINSHFSNYKSFIVFCGPGNNGGDGLVIARLLKSEGKNVQVVLVGEKFSEDNLENQKRYLSLGESFIEEPDVVYEDRQIIIDALFGTGLKKSLQNEFKSLVEKLNTLHQPIISIDLPSGLQDDQYNEEDVIVKADLTLTFQFPKLVFFLPQTGIFIGEFVVLDIGLHPEALQGELPLGYFLNQEMVTPLLKTRQKFSHKGSFGHACLIGGEYGKIGAIELATLACMRSGAGLTTAIVPKCGFEIMQTATPEAMVITSNGEKFHDDLKTDLTRFTAIGIGPGMGKEKETENVFKYIIQNTVCPLVIDADALNILAENKTWLAFLPPECILTPHPGEFKRLVGDWKNDFERLELQKEFAFKNNCILILKGAYTSIATPSKNVYFNSTGNVGLAKGGSGDSLTGILTSLLAQGYSSLETALLGVFIHGRAADLAIGKTAVESLLATDVIQNISGAIESIKH